MSPTRVPLTNGNPSRHPTGPPDAIGCAIRAKDVMTAPVIFVSPDAAVRDIAALLTRKHISAVPVLDHGAIVGIVSDRELVHRGELGTDTACWIAPEAPADLAARQAECERSHALRAADVMVRDVVTVQAETPLPEVADILDARRVRRVLVMDGAALAGILSLSDIVRALAARPDGAMDPACSDYDMVRYKVMETLVAMRGTSPWATTVNVAGGIVELEGFIEDEALRDPSRIAIEKLPHVVEVRDRRVVIQPF